MTTIERPFHTPGTPERKSRLETTFAPRDFELLSLFENNGWMVVAGAPIIKKSECAPLVNGSVVNLPKDLIAKAKTLFPAALFGDYFIAYDTTNDQYVVVHKRTPLGESEWQRANR